MEINKKEINRTLDFIENIIKDTKPFPQDRQGMTLIEKGQIPEDGSEARIRKERKMLDEGYVHESFMR